MDASMTVEAQCSTFGAEDVCEPTDMSTTVGVPLTVGTPDSEHGAENPRELEKEFFDKDKFINNEFFSDAGAIQHLVVLHDRLPCHSFPACHVQPGSHHA